MLDEIYREELMEICRNPQHKGPLEEADVKVDLANHFCGDQIQLALQIEEGKIKNAKFLGHGCLVNTVASELLIDEILGKELQEVKKISKESFLKKLNLNLSTSRVSCATLIIKALKQALGEYEKQNHQG